LPDVKTNRFTSMPEKVKTNLIGTCLDGNPALLAIIIRKLKFEKDRLIQCHEHKGIG